MRSHLWQWEQSCRRGTDLLEAHPLQPPKRLLWSGLPISFSFFRLLTFLRQWDVRLREFQQRSVSGFLCQNQLSPAEHNYFVTSCLRRPTARMSNATRENEIEMLQGFCVRSKELENFKWTLRCEKYPLGARGG